MASSADLSALQTATTLSATLSLLGSGFVIVQTSRHGARSKRDWLLIILSAFDFVASFAMIFGQRFASDEPNTACVAQAAGIQFFLSLIHI